MGFMGLRSTIVLVLAVLAVALVLTCGEKPTDSQSQTPFEISKIEGYSIGDRLAGFKITGSGFTDDLEVDVDGLPMALNIQSDTLIEAALLDSIGEGEHTIKLRKLSRFVSGTINIFRGANGKGLIWKGDLAAAPLTPDTNWAYRDTVKNIAYIYNGNSWDVLIMGIRGVDGSSIQWQGSLPAAPTSPATNWAYYNTAEGISYVYSSGSWQIIARDGTAGPAGADGKSIIWKGSLATEPSSPDTNWVYFNSAKNVTFIYDGAGWDTMTVGVTGASGTNGTNGTSGTNGNNGTAGVAGLNGISLIWKGNLSTAPSSPDTNWAYYNTADKKSYIWANGAWQTLAVDGAAGTSGTNGANGTNGVNGKSLVWKGALSTAPSSPDTNWAYYNTSLNISYLWDGDSWEILCASSELVLLAPSGLTATYDALNGRITLKWNRVNASNVAGYIVYRNDTATSDIPAVVSGLRRLTDTVFVDQVFSNLLDPANYIFKYRVKSQDTAANQSANFSTAVLISAPSPTTVRTIWTWHKAYPIGDSASINDTVSTDISYTNPTRNNVQIQWFVGHIDSLKSTKAVFALTGKDTLKYAWVTAGTKKVYVKITDGAGTIWTDSTTVNITPDLPSVSAGGDTTVSVSDSFSVHFSGSDVYGSIAKFRIDKDGNGTFDDSATVAGTKRFKASSSAANYNVVVQAQDDDGNVKNDTMVLHVILDLPTVSAGPDTNVSASDSFNVHFSGSDVYGSIVKFRIDADGNGTFDDSAATNGTKKFKASGSIGNYNVIVQAQDDDGNVKNDTMQLHVVGAFAYAAAGQTVQAGYVTNGAITIDGSLSEGAWVTAGIYRMDNTQNVVDGIIDGNADCYADFSVLWNETGLYVGSTVHDDVHNAMNSQYLDAANIAYDDDGLQYWFDYNYDDAYNSTATSPALYYLQLVKGFGNLDPATQFGGWWGGDDGSGKGWSTGIKTVAEQHAMGWYEVFTSTDGLNYTSELFIEWSGSIMHQSTKAAGDSLAMDIKVTDNDGAFTAEGGLSWSGLSPWTSYGLHFVKVKLMP